MFKRLKIMLRMALHNSSVPPFPMSNEYVVIHNKIRWSDGQTITVIRLRDGVQHSCYVDGILDRRVTGENRAQAAAKATGWFNRMMKR